MSKRRLLICTPTIDQGILAGMRDSCQRYFPEFEVVILAGATQVTVLPAAEEEQDWNDLIENLQRPPGGQNVVSEATTFLDGLVQQMKNDWHGREEDGDEEG